MPGPGAAAGAKAAGSAAGRVSGGAAAQSASAPAPKGVGKAAGGRSVAGKGGGQGGRGKSLSRLPSFRSKEGKRDQKETQELFSSDVFWKLAIAAGGLMFFLVVIVAPLVVLQASASSCGREEDAAVPIQTNHQLDPEDLSKTQIEIRIYLVGQVMHMTPRQIVTAYATGFVETKMRNLHWGGATSRGVFQQRDFSPWTDGGRNRMNVIDAAISFFLRLRELDEGQPIGELAQDVQVSAYPERYYDSVKEGVGVYNRIHGLVGSVVGVRGIQSLKGVTISGAGLNSLSLGSACSGLSATGPANLKRAVTLYRPRSYQTLPANLWAGGGSPEQVDTRIWQDAVWVMTNYHLKATASRETGHKTHGDGTAIDMVPAEGSSQHVWDSTALKLALDLGWTSACASSGISRTVGGSCDFVPAIIFIGYNGFDSAHGDPQHSSSAHIHVSWYSSCYGCGGGELVEPRDWVKAFPVEGSTPTSALQAPSLVPSKNRGGKYDGKA